MSLPLELGAHPRSVIQDKVTEILTLVGLSNRAHHYPAELSGGQKQRVALARALVSEVDLLLCDEFTSALDPETTLDILELLKEINKKLGVTVLLISHDMGVVREICDDLFVMDQGRIIEEGPFSDVYLNPKHSVTKRLFSSEITRDLPHHILERISAHPEPGRDNQVVMKLVFSDSSAQKPLISILSREFTLDLNIIAGHLDHVRERAYGSLIVSFEYKPQMSDRVIDFFKLHNVFAEILGYLAS